MSTERGAWGVGRRKTDRRTFIKGMGGLALGALMPYALRPRPHARRLGAIGLQLYTLRDKMAVDVEATLAAVAAVGYTEVEFAGYFNKTPAEIRAMLDRHGLKAPAAHVGSIAAEEWKASLDAAQTIGHEYIIIPWIPNERRTLDGYKRVADDFNRAAALARGAGLQFAYHNHDFEFAPVEGRIPLDILLENTDPKLVQLEMDLYWITKGGGDPLAYFRRWPGRVPLVHVKDSRGAPQHVMADVGAGGIDWKRIFARSAQAGIRHYFVEHDNPGDPLASIKTSYEYLRRLEF